MVLRLSPAAYNAAVLSRPRTCQLFRRIATNSAQTEGVSEVTSLSAQKPSPQSSNAVLEPLSYHVERTASQQLPIYHLAKRGGNLKQTRIRRISGDVKQLREDLVRALSLGNKDVQINTLTKHILIKGWRKLDVAKFLQDRYF